jgi:hypothetical protein
VQEGEPDLFAQIHGNIIDMLLRTGQHAYDWHHCREEDDADKQSYFLMHSLFVCYLRSVVFSFRHPPSPFPLFQLLRTRPNGSILKEQGQRKKVVGY